MEKYKKRSILQKEINSCLASYLMPSASFNPKYMLVVENRYKDFIAGIAEAPLSYLMNRDVSVQPILIKYNIPLKHKIFDVVLLNSFNDRNSVNDFTYAIRSSISDNGILLVSSYHLSRIENFKPDIYEHNNIVGINALSFQCMGNVLIGNDLKNVVSCTETISVQYDCPYTLFSDLVLNNGFSREKMFKIKRFAKLRKRDNFKLKFEVIYGQARKLTP